jgi:hypothetical protein
MASKIEHGSLARAIESGTHLEFFAKSLQFFTWVEKLSELSCLATDELKLSAIAQHFDSYQSSGFLDLAPGRCIVFEGLLPTRCTIPTMPASIA